MRTRAVLKYTPLEGGSLQPAEHPGRTSRCAEPERSTVETVLLGRCPRCRRRISRVLLRYDNYPFLTGSYGSLPAVRCENADNA